MRSVFDPSHTRRDPLKSTEDFRMHILGGNTPVSQPINHVLQECRWATKIEVTIPWHFDSLQQSCVNVPSSVEVHLWSVCGGWPAVDYVASRARELFQQRTRLLREWMFTAIARRVDPPHLPF